MATAKAKPLFSAGGVSHFYDMVRCRNADVAKALSEAAHRHSRGVRECIGSTAAQIRQVVGDVSVSAIGITETLITSQYLLNGPMELAFGAYKDEDAVSQLKAVLLGELNKPN